jgi:hypothetical protein
MFRSLMLKTIFLLLIVAGIMTVVTRRPGNPSLAQTGLAGR